MTYLEEHATLRGSYMAKIECDSKWFTRLILVCIVVLVVVDDPDLFHNDGACIYVVVGCTEYEGYQQMASLEYLRSTLHHSPENILVE